MDVKAITPILNVSDLHASFSWFEQIGWRRLWDWGAPPTFGAVGCGEVEIFLCVDGQGGRDGEGVWLSWWLESPAAVAAAWARAVAAGLQVLRPPADEPWRVREFHLRHPDGHVFRVGAGLDPCA